MAKREANILIVDDDQAVLHSARLLLKQEYTQVRTESDPRKVPFLLQDFAPDLVLLDLNFKPGEMRGQEGLHWLQEVKKRSPDTAVILVTAYGDLELAVEGMKLGAQDFVTKPWANEKFLITIANALTLQQTRRKNEQLQAIQQQAGQPLSARAMLLGQSGAMGRVFRLIDKVAETDANVLLLGENGTGKELVARAIHEQSLRSKEVFVNVDLGALSESLFESELFGHVKGAFTDAREDKAGRFELAQGGTILLDEIGNLDIALQAKLLTVLQRRQVSRLGAHKEIALDIRLICATNRVLDHMVQEGSFREDLLYRINTVTIPLPGLRERREDIPLLVNHFVETFTNKYQKEPPTISASTMQELVTAAWPGNVRELMHATERAIILSEGEALQTSDFLPATASSTPARGKQAGFNIAEHEKQLIMEAIAAHEGNITKAARALGIDRQALYRRMHKHDIQ